MTKASKASVHYTDHAENHNERCAVCKHFERGKYTHLCEIVMGNIAPGGWCEEFKKRAAAHR